MENALLAAFKAEGRTVLNNCAIEPEIKDLIKFLNKLGGNIKVNGRKISIIGCNKVNKSINYKIIFDRIELGTYMIAAALIGRKILFDKIDPKLVNNEINVLKKMGVRIKVKNQSIEIFRSKYLNKIIYRPNLIQVFPQIYKPINGPNDLCKGKSTIKENIFENRFMHVPELKRMGANIEIKNKKATIIGPSKLTGAEVMATDLRASVSLVLAGLVAENRTIINRIYHLDRGYESLEKKLKNCKANIKRI